MSDRMVRNALLSVSDKEGVVALAQALRGYDVNLLSTGGTHKMLSEAGCEVTEVSDHTGFPEMMAGRVKTLHPTIHGGLLGRRDLDDAVMQEHGIAPIDLLVSNLYPFEQTVARPDATLTDAIENIDIGGPAMVRSAAKNHDRVAVVVDPADYERVLAEMKETGGAIGAALRFELAVKAFTAIARYDAAIANYLGAVEFSDGEPQINEYPSSLTRQFHRKQGMRYGENPHQSAAFYVEDSVPSGTVAAARQIHGKALSYNNVADTDAALECVKAFSEPACVIVKHGNPCGVALADDLLTAYDRAFATDTVSPFGGIIAINRPLSVALASAILERQFVEVIIAPGVDDGVAEVLKAKKNVRVLDCGSIEAIPGSQDYKKVAGGLLVQSSDTALFGDGELVVASERQPSAKEHADLVFAWTVAKFVKSNAIVYARDAQTIGVGAGQMSRVISAKIANLKAAEEGLDVRGSVMASDALFPFRDGIDAAAEVGITAVIQPGGSIRDEEVIAAANEAGMAMVFTGMRHFRH